MEDRIGMMDIDNIFIIQCLNIYEHNNYKVINLKKQRHSEEYHVF